MKKNFTMLGFFLVISVLCGSVLLAERYKERRPTPEEGDWLTGVYDYTYSTNQGHAAQTTRSGRVVVSSNAISVNVTNASMTTNALVTATTLTQELITVSTNPTTGYIANGVSYILYSNGSFTIGLSATNRVVGGMPVKYFINNY